MEWTWCPHCALVAEVLDRDAWPSTDGPVEHVHVRCVAGHRFVLPAATLELHHAAQAGAAPDAAQVRATQAVARQEPASRSESPFNLK